MFCYKIIQRHRHQIWKYHLKLIFTSVPPQPNTAFLLTLILWTRGANRNTKSSTVAMELWNIFLRLFSSSSLELLWQGSPGEPWFSIWWIKALLLPPQLDPRSVPPNRSLLQSWGASRSIQWRVWRSFVSATPSLSWWPAWDTHRVRLRQTLWPEQWMSIWGLENTLALLWETLAFLCLLKPLLKGHIHFWGFSQAAVFAERHAVIGGENACIASPQSDTKYSWPLKNMGWTTPVHLEVQIFFSIVNPSYPCVLHLQIQPTRIKNTISICRWFNLQLQGQSSELKVTCGFSQVGRGWVCIYPLPNPTPLTIYFPMGCILVNNIDSEDNSYCILGSVTRKGSSVKGTFEQRPKWGERIGLKRAWTLTWDRWLG